MGDAHTPIVDSSAYDPGCGFCSVAQKPRWLCNSQIRISQFERTELHYQSKVDLFQLQGPDIM
ncbi:hypothetical protein J6590_028693 [Homalodisca vitripennis]|nr:hypothetical protein J6590_028693 [Homalodisca vitripennis]